MHYAIDCDVKKRKRSEWDTKTMCENRMFDRHLLDYYYVQEKNDVYATP